MKKHIKIGMVFMSALLFITACSKANAGVNNSENDNETYSKIKTIDTPDDFKGNAADINDDRSGVRLKSGDIYAVITVKDYGEIICKLYPEAAPEGVQNFIDLADSGYYTDTVFNRVFKDYIIQGGAPANEDETTPKEEKNISAEYNKKMRHYYGALCYADAAGTNSTQFYIVAKKTFEDVSENSIIGELAELDNQISEVVSIMEQADNDDEKAYLQQYLDYYTTKQAILSFNQLALNERTEEIEKKYSAVGGIPSGDGGYTVFGQTVKGFDVLDAISEAEVEESIYGEFCQPVQEIVISSVEIKTA